MAKKAAKKVVIEDVEEVIIDEAPEVVADEVIIDEAPEVEAESLPVMFNNMQIVSAIEDVVHDGREYKRFKTENFQTFMVTADELVNGKSN